MIRFEEFWILKELIDDILSKTQKHIEGISPKATSLETVHTSKDEQTVDSNVDDEYKKLLELKDFKNKIEELRELLENYYFMTTEVEKDECKVIEIYKNLKREILTHEYCKLFVEDKINIANRQLIESTNRHAIDFIKEVIATRKEHGEIRKTIKSLEKEKNELEKISELPYTQIHEEQRDYIEAKEICKSLESKLKEKEDSEIIKCRQEHEKKTKDLTRQLSAQNKIIDSYEKELDEKVCRLEEEKLVLKSMRKERCKAMIDIANKLNDIKFANLNLIFDYLCLQNEISAVLNKSIPYKYDMEYKEKYFIGLLATELKDEEEHSDYIDCEEQCGHEVTFSVHSDPLDQMLSVYEDSSLHLDKSSDITHRQGYNNIVSKEEEEGYLSSSQSCSSWSVSSFNTKDIQSDDYMNQQIKIDKLVLNKYSLFSIHRTTLTPIIEHKLRITRKSINEQTTILNALRKKYELFNDLLEKKICNYGIGWLNMKQEQALNKIGTAQLNIIEYQLRRYDEKHKKWLKSHDAFQKKIPTMQQKLKHSAKESKLCKLNHDSQKALLKFLKQDSKKFTENLFDSKKKLESLKSYKKLLENRFKNEIDIINRNEKQGQKKINQQLKEIIKTKKAVADEKLLLKSEINMVEKERVKINQALANEENKKHIVWNDKISRISEEIKQENVLIQNIKDCCFVLNHELVDLRVKTFRHKTKKSGEQSITKQISFKIENLKNVKKKRELDKIQRGQNAKQNIDKIKCLEEENVKLRNEERFLTEKIETIKYQLNENKKSAPMAETIKRKAKNDVLSTKRNNYATITKLKLNPKQLEIKKKKFMLKQKIICLQRKTRELSSKGKQINDDLDRACQTNGKLTQLTEKLEKEISTKKRELFKMKTTTKIWKFIRVKE